MEEADTCSQCGMPRAWCRDNEVGRRRFDISEEFCWATYRVALRHQKHEKEKIDGALRAAYIHSARIVPKHAPDLMAGLDPREERDGRP
jgi:hypothetical protein